MKTLMRTLTDSELGMLPVLAQVWGAKIDNLGTPDIISALNTAMLDRQKAEKVWTSLNDDQRGALQALLGTGGKMSATMYTRLFGEIRHMGAAQIERELPQQNPQSSAEALFYKGLIAQAFEQSDAGARPIIYVPDDLIPVLPTHKTAYENLAAETPRSSEQPEMGPLEDVTDVRQADTSVVDDLATLLAYLQLHGAQVEEEDFSPADRDLILLHLLNDDETRLAFLLGVGISADLIAIEEGRATTKRAEVRRWLSEPRASQVKLLADAWRTSTAFRDLWHVPGLQPEGMPNYDATIAREAMMNFISEIAPEQDWWALDEFIEVVKHTDADFQRPGGDYDSWYIRSEAGDYLRGFESWDAVEGALLEFYITGPMHWLGLADLADDAARLTAYGRAFLEMIAWPAPPEPEGKIEVQEDGTLLVSRRVSRIDRFQVARFASWVSAGDPYTYRLDGPGISQADRQGINTGHITAFLKRALGEAPIPPKIAMLLQNWQGGATATVTLEKLIVLRTTAPETLNTILDTPALRRYLGAQLGPMAVIVRADQWEALRTALGDAGIRAELVGL